MLAANRRGIGEPPSQRAEPLRVELPPELETFFKEYGYQSCPEDEIRENARLSVRGEVQFAFSKTPAKIESLLAHPTLRATGLIKDLSRSGMALLYHKQLYPTQELKVFFHGRELTVIVVRCMKIATNCYEIGARVIKTVKVDTNRNSQQSTR